MNIEALNGEILNIVGAFRWIRVGKKFICKCGVNRGERGRGSVKDWLATDGAIFISRSIGASTNFADL